VANSIIGVEDMVFHSLFIGATGAGKTNALLYWLQRLSSDRRDVALVLIEPHGDAAIDLVRAIPRAEREGLGFLKRGGEEEASSHAESLQRPFHSSEPGFP
jgi:hypothetical protein